jgi:hypothetical protein
VLQSSFRELGPVVLPQGGSRQFYMHGFDAANPQMPEGYDDYLDPVLALLEAAGVHEGKSWMTVDEKVVLAGMSQRRPGPHVDGKFNIKAVSWGGGGGGWNHSCNLIPTVRTPVIVASTVSACRAWAGEFDAVPNESGGLEHIEDQLGEGVILPAHVGYLLSGDCIHESMRVERDTQRTFLRIALPQMERLV